MLSCTLLFSKCMVATGSSIACFATIASFVMTSRVCLELTPDAIERRCLVVASMASEG